MKDETVEKVVSAAWKGALAIMMPFAAIVASVYLIPEWLAENVSTHPLQLVMFGLLAVAAGVCIGIVIGAAVAGLGKRKSEDRLAAITEVEETRRRAKAEEEATKRGRIQAESKAEIERMRQKREEWKEFERQADEALAEERNKRVASIEEERRVLLRFKGLSVEQLRAAAVLYHSREPACGISDYTTMMALREAGVAFTPATRFPDIGSRWVLKPEWRQLIAEHENLFEQVLVENDLTDIMGGVKR